MKTFITLFVLCTILLQACKEEPKKNQIKETASVDATILSQSTVKIIPIAHATMVLEWNDKTIYVDPVGGSEAFERAKTARFNIDHRYSWRPF